MDLDPVFLSRVQFAWVIAWHILLPAFTVGLAAFIAVLEGLNFFTKRQVYLRISMFWIKIFSISFGMGVVTLSCPFSSARTGAATRTPPPMFCRRCSPTKA
jgi:cytochrome d ubiquinol oxidase subunit I